MCHCVYRSKLLTSFLGNPVRILYSEGKYSFAPKKFIKSLAAVGGGGGDEMKSCSDLWGGGGGLSLPSIYVWLETSAVQWCHLGTGSALCKVSLHSPPQARGEHCLPSIVVSPIVRSRYSVAGEFIQQCNMAEAWTIPRLFLPREKMGSDTRLAGAKCKTVRLYYLPHAWLQG